MCYKILITGANGFVGRRLVSQLQNYGHQIYGVGKPTKERVIGENFFEVDLQEKGKTTHVIKSVNPNFVIHLAGSKIRGEKTDLFFSALGHDNAINMNVLEACLTLPNLKRFIFFGSCEEYGACSSPFSEKKKEEPISGYGLSKLATTNLLRTLHRKNDFPSTILRPSIIYGPNQANDMFIPKLVETLWKQQDFLMTKGEQTRDFIFLDDVVTAVEKLLRPEKKYDGQVYNIGYGQSVSIKSVAYTVANLFGKNYEQLLKFGAVNYRDPEIMNYELETAKATKVLSWSPQKSLEEGLSLTLEAITKRR